MTREITTLLIANRGEIARRIMRTCEALGIRTVAVYSDPDAGLPFVAEADIAVALRGSSAAETYLDIAKLLYTAMHSGADAVHPGYGFLSENATFAAAVEATGLIWVGPTPEQIEKMGSKIEAKRLAVQAGVPTAPSISLSGEDAAVWRADAATAGFPLLIKASAGGGGRGMRVVRTAAELETETIGARREAASAFGDGTVFAERYVEGARHVEVQLFGDEHGNLVHLFERECSIQRRHQKIVEEAPSPGVEKLGGKGLRERMCADALKLARSIGYRGAGTVEFLLDDSTGEYFFLEMNTRLQVEHPVTEMVTNIDLVAWQLDVAQGRPIPLTQDEIALSGHAIEVRLYAEDPANGYLPSTGTLHTYQLREGRNANRSRVRVESGYASGNGVSPFYDPMLAKLISHGETRTVAARQLGAFLRGVAIHGITTNREQLVAICQDTAFLAGKTTTAYLGEHLEVERPAAIEALVARRAVAALVVCAARRRRDDRLWGMAPSGWRNVFSSRQRADYVHRGSGADEQTLRLDYDFRALPELAVNLNGTELVGRLIHLDLATASTADVTLELRGFTVAAQVVEVGDKIWVNDSEGQSEFAAAPRFAVPGAVASGGGPTAPVPGRVVAVHVAAGDRVVAGQLLVTVEAMKMEHRIEAPDDGIVTEVRVGVGDQVDARQLLVVLGTVEQSPAVTE